MPPVQEPSAAGGEANELPVGALAKYSAVAVIAAMVVLAFTAPWVSFSIGSSSIGITLSRKVLGMPAFADSGSGPGWAIAFAIILGLVALAIIGASDTADDFEGAKALAGGVATILVVATWLGRSVWLGSVPSGEDGIDLSMGWAYWVCLALAVALFFIPASLGRPAPVTR